jgi:hypothetical protein
MRGFLKVKEGKLEWTGNWAMSTEAFDLGDKAKFRYEMRGASNDFEKDNRISSMPQTALFDGSFLVKAAEAPNGYNRIDEKAIRMDFTPSGVPSQWKITGTGVNQIAEFVLEGELDGTSRRMALYKTYVHDANGSSDGSDSEMDDDEAELDPDELADLQADQRQSFGAVLGSSEGRENKPKKRRMVEG